MANAMDDVLLKRQMQMGPNGQAWKIKEYIMSGEPHAIVNASC
jgi:hypothetical protein